jgi:hypothetical protein
MFSVPYGRPAVNPLALYPFGYRASPLTRARD